MKYYYYYKTPIGGINLFEEDNFITNLEFIPGLQRNIEGTEFETDLIKQAYQQLIEYFNGNRKEFDLPLNPKGTEFQRKSWTELKKIPYGTSISYKLLAERVGSPKGYRAVGLASNQNPIAIIIPCHRVIGSSGKLVGYAGGLNVKKYLLELELKNTKRNCELF